MTISYLFGNGREENENMHFQPGWEGGPGRPKGSCGGRAKALQILDAMLSKADIQE